MINFKTHFHQASRVGGWTLIEVLVALVLMTLLSLLGYKGISTMITTESSIRDETQRLLDLESTFTQVDMDWRTQSASLPPMLGKTSTTPIKQEENALPLDASRWEFTPMPGWIPSPAVLPKVPDPIAAYLSQRYVIQYVAHPQGGVDRSVGCVAPLLLTPASINTPSTPCQQWHRLHYFPVVIEGSGSQRLPTQSRWMRWTVTTPKGVTERLWAFSARR